MTPDATIHVVDDDQAVRDSVGFLLKSNGLACLTYESAAALLARAPSLEPGCILSDVRMPHMSGLEMVAELKRRGVVHPVVMLTGHADVALAVEAMKAGVMDFLEKPFEEQQLLRAVRSALAVGHDKAARLAGRAEIAARIAELTTREREVFDAVVDGDSNKVIAQKLLISPRTVEIYRANVMSKMRANTLSELVRMALSQRD
ncbi:MAG: response regulator FixJ [Hyphomonadaceae bacterium]|nr:response regulator FixJ [Hyphomonadaceae bacterium]